MKIIIYLENNNSIYQLKDEQILNININLTKDTLYYGETNVKFVLSDIGNQGSPENTKNINMKLMNAINSDINRYNETHKTTYLLEKFKCIGKEKEK